MTVDTFTLTGDLRRTIGPAVTVAYATLHLNTPDGSWVNTIDHAIHLPGDVIPLTSAQTFSIELPSSTVTGLQYEVRVEFSSGREPGRWRSGWFSMTADDTLDGRAEATELRITRTLGEQLAARIDGVLDHGTVSGTVEIDPATGMHELDASGPTTLVLLDPPGKVLNLIVYSGADQVSIDGLPALTLADAAVASLYFGRNGWTVAAAGAAAGPTDSTPPSAPTGLSATGGAGELTFSFTPGTDADSAVTHRYEVYTGASAGTSSLVTSNPMTVTGLSAGSYTVRVFARSAGGNSTVVTTTATVTAPPGWSAWDSIDFATQTAGTYTAPKDFTTTGGRTLRATATGNVIVGSGKIKAPYQQYGGMELAFASATPPSASRVSIPLELVGTDSSYGPGVSMVLGMTTGAIKVSAEWNWSSGNSRRLILGPDYGSGVVYTAGPGYTLAGSSVDGIPATGTLKSECVGQVLNVYLDAALLISADFTNHLYGGSPNGLVGEFRRAAATNDGAIFGITWETYS